MPEGRARYQGRLFGPIQGHLGLFYTIYGYIPLYFETEVVLFSNYLLFTIYYLLFTIYLLVISYCYY